ncbi:hypothetical protein PMIN02_007739 [Paraphaeosphaeria minitans]
MESKAGSDFRPRVAGSSSDHCLDFGTKLGSKYLQLYKSTVLQIYSESKLLSHRLYPLATTIPERGASKVPRIEPCSAGRNHYTHRSTTATTSPKNSEQDLGIDAASSVNEGHLAVEKQMRDIGAELYLEVQQYLGEELDVERKAALRRINWVYYADDT